MTEVLRSTKRWLEIATYGLCMEAKEHLGVEIEAKYQAALAEAQAAGADAAAARRSAMAALGDAKEARSEYRKRYLRELEIAYLRWIRDGVLPRSVSWGWINFFFFWFFFWRGDLKNGFPMIPSILLWAGFLALPVMKYIVTPWFWRKGKMTLAYTSAGLPWLLLVAGFAGKDFAHLALNPFLLLPVGSSVLLFLGFYLYLQRPASPMSRLFDDPLNRRWAGVYRGPGDDDVETWITAATCGLCDDARNRLTDEIQMHYQDAVVDLTAEGMDTAAAHRTALRDLGNPYQARAAYRRTYLTHEQDRYLRMLAYLQSYETHAVIILILLMGSPLLLAAFLGIPPGSTPNHAWQNLWRFLAVFLYYGGLYWANRRAFLRAPLHKALLSHLNIVLLGLTPPTCGILWMSKQAGLPEGGLKQTLVEAGPLPLIFFYFLGSFIVKLAQLSLKAARGNVSFFPPDTPMAGE